MAILFLLLCWGEGQTPPCKREQSDLQQWQKIRVEVNKSRKTQPGVRPCSDIHVSVIVFWPLCILMGWCLFIIFSCSESKKSPRGAKVCIVFYRIVLQHVKAVKKVDQSILDAEFKVETVNHNMYKNRKWILYSDSFFLLSMHLANDVQSKTIKLVQHRNLSLPVCHGNQSIHQHICAEVELIHQAYQVSVSKIKPIR